MVRRDGCGAWDKGERMERMEMRGSGAMRVENGHWLATCCGLCMLLSNFSCCIGVEAP